MENELYGRQVSLFLLPSPVLNNPSAFTAAPGDPLDLSAMHITFKSKQNDQEGPNSCVIRIHNLAPELVVRIKNEYGRVVLQAGYTGAYFGVIFDGTIKQWREGREPDKTDTYLDILAADGDIAYNFAMVNTNVPAGSSQEQRLGALLKTLEPFGVTKGSVQVPATGTGGTNPRGRVLFGLSRALIRAETLNFGSTWNIQNGKVNVVPLAGYVPGKAVVLNSMTGLIGRPEQTLDGVTARCLINPRISVGSLVEINNDAINQVLQQKDHAIAGAQLPFDKWVGVQRLATIASDGLYRVYVAEYDGDSRGGPWYMDLILLSVDPVSKVVKNAG